MIWNQAEIFRNKIFLCPWIDVCRSAINVRINVSPKLAFSL